MSLLFAVVVLGVATYLVVTNWSELRAITIEIGAGPMALSALLGLAGTALICQVWTAYLKGVGVLAARRDVSQVFFVTQLGKYLPGSVWPVVAQMEAGRRWNTGRGTMLVTSALMLIVLTVTGLGLGVLLLPWASSAGLRQYWWITLVLVPLVALLHPKVTPWLLDRALRLMGRPAVNVRLTWGATLRAGAWSVAAWCVLGGHVYVLISALGARGMTPLIAAVGGMALAWAVGLIVVPAPAGAGVRDTVLVLTLGPFVGTTAALTVALASRLLLLCADLILAGISLVMARWRREPGLESDSSAVSDQ